MTAVLSAFLFFASWYSGGCEGWYYFQEKEDANAVESAAAVLEEEKLVFQETLSEALLTPTPENIRRYLTLAQHHTKRSAAFATACEKEKNR